VISRIAPPSPPPIPAASAIVDVWLAAPVTVDDVVDGDGDDDGNDLDELVCDGMYSMKSNHAVHGQLGLVFLITSVCVVPFRASDANI